MARVILENIPTDSLYLNPIEGNAQIYAEIYVYGVFQKRHLLYRGMTDLKVEDPKISDVIMDLEATFPGTTDEGLISSESIDNSLYGNVSNTCGEFDDTLKTLLYETDDQSKEYFDLTVKIPVPKNETNAHSTPFSGADIENSLHIKEDLGIQQVEDIDDAFDDTTIKDIGYCSMLPNSDDKDTFSFSEDKRQAYDSVDGEFSEVITENPVLSQTISTETETYVNNDKRDLSLSPLSEDVYSCGTYMSTDDYSNSVHKYSEKRNSHRQHKEDAKCSLCSRKCKSINALNHHMLVHSEARPYACEICKKAFKEQPTLRRHMWTHMAKQHQCDICKKFFVEKSSLRRHMSTIHADFKPGSKNNQQNSKQQYCCCKCGKLFKSLIKYHMHEQMHGNPNFECRTCGKVYAGRSHLKIHQRIHTGEKPFTCDMCNAKFAFKHVLKSHQARIHQSISNLTCNICFSTFEKKSDLSDHIVSSHISNMKKVKYHYGTQRMSEPTTNATNSSSRTDSSGPSVFSQLVGLAPELQFEDLQSSSTNLDNFEECYSKLCKTLVDHDNKDKKCQTCNKEFERVGDLKRHIISHAVQLLTSSSRKIKSNPKFKCGLCIESFNELDKLKAHLREHASLILYQCEFCNRTFGDSSNYSKHKKIHGDKYLQCDICKRKFNTKLRLITHMEHHKNNFSFTCNLCDKVCHYESDLKKHIKSSHHKKMH